MDHLIPHFKLGYPLDEFIITQPFGANYNGYYEKLGLDGHNGLDFRAYYVPTYAVHDGKVVSAGTDSGGGKFVKYETDPIEVDGTEYTMKFLHYHLSSRDVETGELVKKGQEIGVTGNTGKYTSGPHLHLGDTLYWKEGNSWFRDYNNGFKGSIDPMPFFQQENLNDIKSMIFVKNTSDPKVYVQIGGQLVWVDLSWDKFLKQFPNPDVISLSDTEFKKFPLSNLSIK